MEHQESPPCKSTEKSPDLNFWGSIHEYLQGTSRKISSKSRKESELKKKHKNPICWQLNPQWSHVLMANPPVISGPRNSRAYPSPHSDLERELSRNFSKGYVLYIYSYSIYIYVCVCIIDYRITVYVGICCQVYSYRCTTTDWWPMPKWYSSFCWQWEWDLVKSRCSCWQNLYRVLFHTPWLKALSHRNVFVL